MKKGEMGMIRRSAEKQVDKREGLFGGSGGALVRSLLNGPEEMYEKGRVFAHTTLPPGSSIGFHIHENESETYYFLRGIGEFNDNGTITTIYPGDVTFTGAGEGHGLKNIGKEDLEFIALILYNKI